MTGKNFDNLTAATNKIWQAFEDIGAAQVIGSIFNSIHEGIEIVDAHGVVRYVNRASEIILGMEKSHREGKNIFELVPDGTLVRVLKSGRSLVGEVLHIPDADVDIIVNTSPLFHNGTMIGAVAVFQEFNETTRLITQLSDSRNLVADLNSKLSTVAAPKYSFDDILGQSKAIKASIDRAKKFARTDAAILLSGETGTGKELFAHAIHRCSDRGEQPFIKLNCAAIPDNLLESELFGHEKGAFTGADRHKLGMFELANHGTIFLDEIGELELSLQSKLLRVLDEGEMYRVGGTKPTVVDIRVVAATNRDLPCMVQEGKFREDLFYRLNVVNLEIPPLRHRLGDVPLLAGFFIRLFSRRHGKLISNIPLTVEHLLSDYSWPGNVRELRNVLQQAIIMAEGTEITTDDLAPLLIKTANTSTPVNRIMSLEEMERRMLVLALEEYGYSLEGKKKAARALKISLRTLYSKIQKYKITSQQSLQ